MAAAAIPNELFFASIAELHEKLVKKEVTATALARAFCDRLESVGPRYNALALPLGKEALRAAKDIDDDLKRERTRGHLQGIPFGATPNTRLLGARNPTPIRCSTTPLPR